LGDRSAAHRFTVVPIRLAVLSHATAPTAAPPGEVRQQAPRVSVLMTVYNDDRYLEDAVRSILDQTFGDFEFLIMDDGSTDRSGAILERLAAEDDRITLFRQDNAGPTKASNALLAEARGELVARMDGDDISAPERFEQQVRYLDRHRACVAVGTRATIIDPDGEPLRLAEVPTEHEEIDRGLIERHGQLMYHSSMMIRRAAMERLGGYDDRYRIALDLDLSLRLAEVGKLANLEAPLLCYREHLRKIGYAHIEEQERTITAMIADAYRRRGLTPPNTSLKTSRRPLSRAELHEVWGWWVLQYGNPGTSRKHAVAAWLRRPWSPAITHLLACSLRGH